MNSNEILDLGEQQKANGAVLVKPVANAIRILRHLSQVGTPERSVDIARQLSINPSTCFNILRTLVAEDVVDFNLMSKRYSAGIGLARLVEQLVTQGQRVQLAKPLLQSLAARQSITVTLWRRLGADRIVIVSSAASPTDVRIDMAEGIVCYADRSRQPRNTRDLRQHPLGSTVAFRYVPGRSTRGSEARLGNRRWPFFCGHSCRCGACFFPRRQHRLYGFGSDVPRSA